MTSNVFSNHLTAEEKFLCKIVAIRINVNEYTLKEQYQSIDKEEVFAKALNDEIVSHLVYSLHQAGIQYNPKWQTVYEETKSRIDNLMSELERVATFLKDEGIQVVGLKNAGIAKGIYKNNGCSPMGDIDLLISAKDFREAHKILIDQLGYTFKFRSELEKEDLEESFKGGGTEYYKEVNGYAVWLELQWRPIAGRWIQPHNEPDGDELMEQSIPIEGSAVRLLSPEDNLLQVCLHTAKHSYCRAPGFRLHTDVDRIVIFTKIDWPLFVDKVKKSKIKTAVYYSLLIPKELLNSPIPEDVVKSFRPHRLRRKIIERLLRKAGLFDQHKRKFSKIGYIVFNLALYDSLVEVLKAIFPPSITMKKRYGFKISILLPYYYIKRILNLALKRAKL